MRILQVDSELTVSAPGGAIVTGYRITPSADGVSIALSGVGDNQRQLLDAFGNCQSGQCSCPTTEYEKVEAFDIDSAEDGIAIRLHAKPGQHFDTQQIAVCLEHTVAEATADDG